MCSPLERRFPWKFITDLTYELVSPGGSAGHAVMGSRWLRCCVIVGKLCKHSQALWLIPDQLSWLNIFFLGTRLLGAHVAGESSRREPRREEFTSLNFYIAYTRNRYWFCEFAECRSDFAPNFRAKRNQNELSAEIREQEKRKLLFPLCTCVRARELQQWAIWIPNWLWETSEVSFPTHFL